MPLTPYCQARQENARNLRLAFKAMQVDYDDITHQAEDETIQQKYESNTEEARQLGVWRTVILLRHPKRGQR